MTRWWSAADHRVLKSSRNVRICRDPHGGRRTRYAGEAVEHARRAVQLARAAGAREAEYLSYLGYREVRAGNPGQGLADCRQAVEQLRAQDGHWELIEGLQRLGIACHIAARPAEAIPHLREAIMLAQLADSWIFLGERLMWLGEACVAAGDADAARAAWQQALDVCNELLPAHPALPP